MAKSSASKSKKMKVNKKTVKDLSSKKNVKGGQVAETGQCKSVRWCRD
jgi:hypothetical protein